MALHILKKAAVRSLTSSLMRHQLVKHYSLWTPDYFETMKPKIPLCPTINVRIKGYDYPILEKYQAWIDRIATHLNFDVEDSFALLGTKYKIDRFKTESSISEAEFVLELYERNLVVSNIPTTQLPIFVRIMEAAMPEGVMLNVILWDPEYSMRKYVPDTQLLNLKDELVTLQKK